MKLHTTKTPHAVSLFFSLLKQNKQGSLLINKLYKFSDDIFFEWGLQSCESQIKNPIFVKIISKNSNKTVIPSYIFFLIIFYEIYLIQ